MYMCVFLILAFPNVTIGSTNYQALVGSSQILECNITADPAVDSVYWEVEVGGLVMTINTSDTSKYSGSTPTDPSLTINSIAFSDEGNYKCYTTNIAGTSNSSQAALDVIGNYVP